MSSWPMRAPGSHGLAPGRQRGRRVLKLLQERLGPIQLRQGSGQRADRHTAPRAVLAQPNLRLLGVQGYGGSWQHMEGANARAARAEARARAAADTDDVLRRTRVLAQRTADALAAVTEATALHTEAGTQVAREGVAGDNDAAFDQHLVDRTVDHRDQLAHLRDLLRDVADHQRVGALVGHDAAFLHIHQEHPTGL